MSVEMQWTKQTVIAYCHLQLEQRQLQGNGYLVSNKIIEKVDEKQCR